MSASGPTPPSRRQSCPTTRPRHLDQKERCSKSEQRSTARHVAPALSAHAYEGHAFNKPPQYHVLPGPLAAACSSQGFPLIGRERGQNEIDANANWYLD